MARLSKIEREEATRVFEAVADLNLGAGLWLRFARATKDGTPRQPYLIHRYTAPSGRRREKGLGQFQRPSVAEVAERLAAARREVNRYREQLSEGIDPIEAQRLERARARQALQVSQTAVKRERATMARVAREYHERVIEPARTDKHSAQWINSLEQHVPAEIWHAPIASIKAPRLLDFFVDVSRRVPETARRIVQRLCTVFADAEFRELIAGNPASAAATKLREVKVVRPRGNFSALPFVKAPAFLSRLRAQNGIAARALEFGMLTVARTGEVIGAAWDEFDLQARTWTIAAARMKAGEQHVIYLSPRAVDIIESMRELGQPFVFPSTRLDGQPLSNGCAKRSRSPFGRGD